MDKDEKAHQQSQRELFSALVDLLDDFKKGILKGKTPTPQMKEDVEIIKQELEYSKEAEEDLREAFGFKRGEIAELTKDPDKLNLTPKQRRLWDQIESLKTEISDARRWMKKEMEIAEKGKDSDTPKKKKKKRKKKFRGLGGKDDWMQA